MSTKTSNRGEAKSTPTGAAWSAEPVADYAESTAATWRRLTAAGVWIDASNRLAEAQRIDPTLEADEAKYRWLRTHYPVPGSRAASAADLPKESSSLPGSTTVAAKTSDSEPEPVETTEPKPKLTKEACAKIARAARDKNRKQAKKQLRKDLEERRRADADGVRELLERGQGAKSSTWMLDDVEWVYRNLPAFEHGLLKPTDAPSLSAWGLLMTAAENPQKFYADVANKVGKTQSEESEKKRLRDDGRKIFDVLDRLDPTGATAGLGLVQRSSAAV